MLIAIIVVLIGIAVCSIICATISDYIKYLDYVKDIKNKETYVILSFKQFEEDYNEHEDNYENLDGGELYGRLPLRSYYCNGAKFNGYFNTEKEAKDAAQKALVSESSEDGPYDWGVFYAARKRIKVVFSYLDYVRYRLWYENLRNQAKLDEQKKNNELGYEIFNSVKNNTTNDRNNGKEN